jgi:lipoate-protein ligase A
VRKIRLLRDDHPAPPALDTAVARATLEAVAAGTLPETLRVHRPAAVLAFGPRDRVAPGFRDAVAAARAHGFASVERLAGGRAAVFHQGTVAFSWAIPLAAPREGIRDRFEETADLMAAALGGLGVDARIGEVPGEYCPGEHSVNAGGRTKLIGIGQRIVSGAVHVGGVVVVTGSGPIRDVLVPVYRALDLEWRPETTGSVEEEVPGLTWEAVADALAARFGERFELEAFGATPPEVIARARILMPRHAVDPSAAEKE